MRYLLLLLLMPACPTFAGEIVREEVRGPKSVRILVGPSPLGLNDDLHVTFAFSGEGVRFTLPKVPAGWVRRSASNPSQSPVEWTLRPLIPGEAVPLDFDGITLQTASDVEPTKIELSQAIFIEVTATLRNPDPSMTKAGYPFEPVEPLETESGGPLAVWLVVGSAIAVMLMFALRRRKPQEERGMYWRYERLRDSSPASTVADVRILDGYLREWLAELAGREVGSNLTVPVAEVVASLQGMGLAERECLRGVLLTAERLIWSPGANEGAVRAWWEQLRSTAHHVLNRRYESPGSGPESPEPR